VISCLLSSLIVVVEERMVFIVPNYLVASSLGCISGAAADRLLEFLEKKTQAKEVLRFPLVLGTSCISEWRCGALVLAKLMKADKVQNHAQSIVASNGEFFSASVALRTVRRGYTAGESTEKDLNEAVPFNLKPSVGTWLSIPVVLDATMPSEERGQVQSQLLLEESTEQDLRAANLFNFKPSVGTWLSFPASVDACTPSDVRAKAQSQFLVGLNSGSLTTAFNSAQDWFKLMRKLQMDLSKGIDDGSLDLALCLRSISEDDSHQTPASTRSSECDTWSFDEPAWQPVSHFVNLFETKACATPNAQRAVPYAEPGLFRIQMEDMHQPLSARSTTSEEDEPQADTFKYYPMQSVLDTDMEKAMLKEQLSDLAAQNHALRKEVAQLKGITTSVFVDKIDIPQIPLSKKMDMKVVLPEWSEYNAYVHSYVH